MAKSNKNSRDEFPARIKVLFSRPQDQWGVREWRTLALWLHGELDKARDGWQTALAAGATYAKVVSDLSDLLTLIRQRHDQFIALTEVLIRDPTSLDHVSKRTRPRGRPRKRDPALFLAQWESESEKILSEQERKLTLPCQLIIPIGKPPALPEDSARFDLYGGRSGVGRAVY